MCLQIKNYCILTKFISNEDDKVNLSTLQKNCFNSFLRMRCIKITPMKLRVDSVGVPSAQLQHDLRNVIIGVRSLACDITDNYSPSQSIQRLAYLTRVQEDQSINKSFENTRTLNALAVNLATNPSLLESIGNQLKELIHY